ncbi:MAG: indole-3-glycerol phosphate synthase TrpC [Alphaproteobacteria bacterium]|nr:indole-3-glycerol phosphate synthase TrpC [Alphaproteobacteria bacterium]
MSDVLERICRDKRDHVARRRTSRPLADLEATIRTLAPPAGFATALAAKAVDGIGLIAEIKKASPSAGLIREDFDARAIAETYRTAGAACLSVLTDTPWFGGRDDDLSAARKSSGLPCLRKDFMVDPYQVTESRAIGADCILVILAAVDDALAGELVATARDHDLDVLVEVHDRGELERALSLDARLVGINNRNLRTLRVDLQMALTLGPLVPPDRDVVCESGLRSHGDLVTMMRAGIRRFLAGEHLMRQADIGAATRALLGDSS